MSATTTVADREAVLLAPYAMHSADSLGRQHEEPSHAYRSPYQRDRDRITHCQAFRRLSHKTQVFTGESGDYHRSRLTHTLEVASIARTLARGLRLNEDLVEALALAHDIGHPPFGHAGEEVLDECLGDAGSFNHNHQALRIFQLLERRYPTFRGLNLSHEVLASQRSRVDKQRGDAPLLEAQVVDVADSLAYNAHDADDAIEMGLVDLDQIGEVQAWSEARERVTSRFGDLPSDALRRATVHELIDRCVSATLNHAAALIDTAAPQSSIDVQSLGVLVMPPPQVANQQQELSLFLFERVYRHPQVIASRNTMGDALARCYHQLLAVPAELQREYAEVAATEGHARAVADYLASLTDRALLAVHRKLFGEAVREVS